MRIFANRFQGYVQQLAQFLYVRRRRLAGKVLTHVGGRSPADGGFVLHQRKQAPHLHPGSGLTAARPPGEAASKIMKLAFPSMSFYAHRNIEKMPKLAATLINSDDGQGKKIFG